jgi:membrane-associated phospholipid phosphatase
MKWLIRIIGALGTMACIVLFIRTPSFPTPDKILVFLIFVFMMFNEAWEMFKRFAPFIIILLVYDSFRGLVPLLNSHVHYTLMSNFDKFMFGTLPTVTLQKWLWHGYVTWYDFMFYAVYMMHFVLPIVLAIIVWKLRASHYWKFVTAYLFTSFAAFVVFLAYPTAPPWLASQNGYIAPIARVSSAVYSAMGIKNFPSLYNHFAPNPVAAVPSLHAAYATLFVLFVFKLFGKKWGTLSLIYPALMIFGVVYMGEHYVFDVVTGIILAVIGFLIAPWLLNQVKRGLRRLLLFAKYPSLAEKIPN